MWWWGSINCARQHGDYAKHRLLERRYLRCMLLRHRIKSAYSWAQYIFFVRMVFIRVVWFVLLPKRQHQPFGRWLWFFILFGISGICLRSVFQPQQPIGKRVLYLQMRLSWLRAEHAKHILFAVGCDNCDNLHIISEYLFVFHTNSIQMAQYSIVETTTIGLKKRMYSEMWWQPSRQHTI